MSMGTPQRTLVAHEVILSLDVSRSFMQACLHLIG